MSFVRESGRLLRVCPFSVWALIYVGAIFLGGILLPRLATAVDQSWIGLSIVVVALASLAAAGSVERNYAQGQDCSWLPDERPRRVGLYLVAFVVGVFVVSPGSSLDRDVLLPFRVMAAITVVSLVALLFVHLRSHGDEDGPPSARDRVLGVVAKAPLYLLCLIAAFILVIGILETVSHPR